MSKGFVHHYWSFPNGTLYLNSQPKRYSEDLRVWVLQFSANFWSAYLKGQHGSLLSNTNNSVSKSSNSKHFSSNAVLFPDILIMLIGTLRLYFLFSPEEWISVKHLYYNSKTYPCLRNRC